MNAKNFPLYLLFIFSFSLMSADVDTAFPNDQTSGSFNVTSGEYTVTFTGGEVRIAGESSLYRSGLRAFMVSNETAVITFSTPASELKFYIRQTSSANALVRLLDADDNELLSMNAISSKWEEVHLVHAEGIHKVEFINTASALAAIEDFEYTALVVEPPVTLTPIDNPIMANIEEGAVKVHLTAIADGMVAPLYGINAPGQTDYIYLIDQVGVLYSFQISTRQINVLLDVSDDLVTLSFGGDERGLLGLAFHPDFASNGFLYTYTSMPVSGNPDFSVTFGADHHSVITEWHAVNDSGTGLNIELDSAREVLRIAQPQFNHNGGSLQFDQNNMLLISLGDGGGSDDQGDGHADGGNGQDFMSPLGSIIRIDPLLRTSANGQYGIPVDNPFTNDNEVLDEAWVTGVRNPYRISVEGNQVYVCDVGQNKIEELSLVSGGENLGWPLKEGSFGFSQNDDADGFVYDPNSVQLPAGLTDPNWEYDHDEGSAIICGFVYQGEITALNGKFIFGDYLSADLERGRLFYDSQSDLIADIPVESGMDGKTLLGFAQSASGEVFVLTNDTGSPTGTTGTMNRITLEPNSMPVAVVSASPLTVDEGGNVTLSASGSSDPDDDPLLFIWSQLSGPDVVLSDTRAVSPSFTAPLVSDTTILEFKVEVSDGHLTDVANVSVSVNNVPAPNTQPDAAAMATPNVVDEGQQIVLSAETSSDPEGDNLSFTWSQTSGTQVLISNNNLETITVTAPDVETTEILTFNLAVSDGVLSDNTSVLVTVNHIPSNNPPVASATVTPATVNEGVDVSLSADGSTDPDSDVLSFVWTQLGGTSVTLDNTTSMSPMFTAPDVTATETLVFRVEVSDGELSDTAEVSVTVNNVAEPEPQPEPAPTPSTPNTENDSGGGSGGFALAVHLIWACLGLVFVRRQKMIGKPG